MDCFVAARLAMTDGERRRNRDILSRGDDEQPRARLRNEQRRVDDQRAKSVALFRQRLADFGKVLAAMRGERAADIFEHDERRRTALLARAPSSAPRTARTSRTFRPSVPRRRRRATGPDRGRTPRRDRRGRATALWITRARRRRAALRRPNWRGSFRPFCDRSHWRKGSASRRRDRRGPCRRRRRIRNRQAYRPCAIRSKCSVSAWRRRRDPKRRVTALRTRNREHCHIGFMLL